MTMQMTRLQDECAETATGIYAHPARLEETPLRTSHTSQRDPVTAHLEHLAARIGRREGAPGSEAMCLQVTISPLAPQSRALTGLTTMRGHGPAATAAYNRRDRVRWPRCRAG
jgi:hypothetical protein